MLLVAIPKSASTSLMRTLGELHNVKAVQTGFPAQAWPEGNRFGAIARYHADVREITADQAAAFTEPDCIYKQHLVPTSNNRSLLADQPPVVLLRDPRDVVLSYRRAERILEHVPRPAFKGLASEEQWLSRAEEIGLIDELSAFCDGWRQVDGTLIIEFDDLLADPDRWIGAIEERWGLARSARPVTLARERYAPRGTIRMNLRRWYRTATRAFPRP